MKRIIRLSLILSASLLAIACSHDADKTYRIGVSQCSADDWRSKMNEEINREIMFHDDVSVEIKSADDNNEKQIRDIRYFMDNGFDIIIAAPNEAAPITPIIREAYDKGIPIITFDRDIVGESYTAHIEVNNTELGASAAKYALSLPDRPRKVLEIQGSPNMTPTYKRHNGFVNVINQYPNIEIVASVYGNWDEKLSAHLMDSLLTLYPDIDLVYAHNDRMAISASETAKSLGFKNIKFIGIDGSPEIGIKAVADNVIDATLLYPTDGQTLVKLALDILKGKPYDRVVYIEPLSPVDISNADILLRQETLLTDETNKIKVLQSKIDEYWNKHTAQTSLLYALTIIVILLFGVFLLVGRMYWQNKRHQKILESKNQLLEEERGKQKELYKQLENATQSKLVFFTNVSHDLRTPLTLIAEPINQLLEQESISEQQKNSLLRIANKNIKILKRLINQILDFRKYENGKMQLNLSEVNITSLLREWSESFYSIARKRDIQLTFDLPDNNSQTVAIDVEKIERVFFNLMSNAFKFTPDNGAISFTCLLDMECLILKVKDSGIGISNEAIGNIFERFYQVDKVHPNGSGIGLALAKAFVELHDGSIDVKSEESKGTEFTVILPVRHISACNDHQQLKPISTYNQPEEIEAELSEIVLPQKDIENTKPLLLVIDDNRDIQQLIKELLADEYNIICASNGQNGVKLAAKYTPDVIICDVMMPIMDGLECCRIIKNEITSSHIPVLMLTACSMDEQRVEGYESGADGYLSKPFNTQVLKTRLKNLIENRKRIKNIYQSDNPIPNISEREKVQKTIEVHSRYEIPGDIDNDFYIRFVELVNNELGNSDLSIDDIAGKMGLGKSQFSRKIKALTNYTPVELIRNFRLKKARKLLTTTDKSISQIAYEVGFSLPAYFSKCYKDAYGESPSDLRNKLGM